ncbi:IPT/TIG domain-containing protein [Pedobacter sp. 22163]|uniref:IPT/TIG domain-containing protein n=1 Tax=Pedobacter sp. 22163 TaxID=3453883 RepID=UPI003F870D28
MAKNKLKAMVQVNFKNCFLVFLLGCFFSQCAKKYEFNPTGIAVVIDSISPTRGTENTEVRIYGKNFPADTAKLRAFFNTKAGLIIERSTNNVVLVRVPAEAGTGTVTLLANGENIAGPVFTYDYDAPVILDVAPLTGIAGTEITINGRKFSAISANNTVNVNGAPALVNSSTATQIRATIPEAKNGRITVVSNNISSQGPVFKFIPQIISLNKTSGYVDDTIILTGKYFDGAPNPLVTFNGVTAPVISVTATSMEVKVPASTSGNVLVNVDGINSNPLAFTYKFSPVITGLSKTSAFANDTLTINGTNFNGTNAPTVAFNGVPATVLNYTNTNVKVRIPSSTTGNITVNVDGVVSNGIMFTYAQNIIARSLTQENPVVKNVSGIDGTQVVLKGANFGTDASRVKVVVGTFNAAVTAIDNGSITFNAPSFSGTENLLRIRIYLDNVEATYPNGNLTFTYVEPTILTSTFTAAPIANGQYNFTFTVDGQFYNATAPNASLQFTIDGTAYNTTVSGNRATITTSGPFTFFKNTYVILVRNKWGSFASAFHREVVINDFTVSRGIRAVTITGSGFGRNTEDRRSVRMYRIINGAKTYFADPTLTSWQDNQIIATFPESVDGNAVYGVEVRVETKTEVKEKAVNTNPVN